MPPKKRALEDDTDDVEVSLVSSGARVQGSTAEEEVGGGGGSGGGSGSGMDIGVHKETGTSPATKKLRGEEEEGELVPVRGSPGTPTPPADADADVDSQATQEYIPREKAHPEGVVIPPTPLREETRVRFSDDETDTAEHVPAGAGAGAGADNGQSCAQPETVPIDPQMWKLFHAVAAKADMPAFYECSTTPENARLSLETLEEIWRTKFGVRTGVLASPPKVAVPLTCHNTMYAHHNPCCVMRLLEVPSWEGEFGRPLPEEVPKQFVYEVWCAAKTALFAMPPLDCVSGMASHPNNHGYVREYLLDVLIQFANCLVGIRKVSCPERRKGLPLQPEAEVFYVVHKLHKVVEDKKNVRRMYLIMQSESCVVSYLMLKLQQAFEATTEGSGGKQEWWEPTTTRDIYLDRLYPMTHMQQYVTRDDDDYSDNDSDDASPYTPQPGKDYTTWGSTILSALDMIVTGLVPSQHTRRTGALSKNEYVLDVCLLKNICDAVKTMYGGPLCLQDHTASSGLVMSLLRCLCAVVRLGVPDKAFFIKGPPQYLQKLLTTEQSKRKLEATRVEVATSVAQAVWALIRGLAIPTPPGRCLGTIFMVKGSITTRYGLLITKLEATLDMCKEVQCNNEAWTDVLANLNGLTVRFRKDLSNVHFPPCTTYSDFSDTEEEEEEGGEEEEGEEEGEEGGSQDKGLEGGVCLPDSVAHDVVPAVDNAVQIHQAESLAHQEEAVADASAADGHVNVGPEECSDVGRVHGSGIPDAAPRQEEEVQRKDGE